MPGLITSNTIPLFNVYNGALEAHLEVQSSLISNASLIFSHRELERGTHRDGYRTVVVSAKGKMPEDILCIHWNEKLDPDQALFFISTFDDAAKFDVRTQQPAGQVNGKASYWPLDFVDCLPSMTGLRPQDRIQISIRLAQFEDADVDLKFIVCRAATRPGPAHLVLC